ncbi:L,D-transpeptidase family protein [Halomonas sp. YLGW01]|uniref:L,D-transpeptidase family protein n=1 Tax=Halomonas sp. YLGW01 TaxID=2773308 RepID=UPI001F5B3BBE|nr:L,D-transpeptidase family protein [Halomonas sp. YLGW01]
MRDVIDRPGRQARRFSRALPGGWSMRGVWLVLGLWLLCAASGSWAQAEAEAANAESLAAGGTVSSTAAVDPSLPAAPSLSPFEAYVRAASETLPLGADLLRFYVAFGFREAWSEAARVEALASALEGLEADGLVADDYRPVALLSEYREAHEEATTPASHWQVELAATQRLLLALRHLYHGKVDPARIDADWEIPRPGFQPDWAAIASAVAAGDPAAALERVRPDQLAYRQLREGLARYRMLQTAGGWAPLVADSGVLRPGDRGPEVVALRRRLAALGELELLMQASVATAGTPDLTQASGVRWQDVVKGAGQGEEPRADQVYDERLVAAVKRFQRRHLLEVDGVVGPLTRAALSVGVSERIAQIRLNLERLRWLSHALPERYVLVDIAGYEVRYVRPDRPAWISRVVVGRPYRSTPTLRSAITHMTFHPTWTVPPTILREDVLPAIRRDPFYLVRHDMRVLDRQGRSLAPWQVDWWRPGPIMIQQRAGPSNPLGEVVIRFPNRHLVYLHDTPSRSLFARAQRSFSSGCIRVEGVRELVRLLFEDDRVTEGEPFGAERLQYALARAGTHNVSLRTPVPVFLFYSTVHPAAGGGLSFRPDVYRRDAMVRAALEKKGADNLFDAP